MTYHIFLVGVPKESVTWVTWAWVDFFFMLSGYFAMVHVQKLPPEVRRSPGKASLQYVFRKFCSYMPYVLIAVLTRYILFAISYLHVGHFKDALRVFLEMPFELGLLSTTGIVEAQLASIWYLSAMFIVLPVILYMISRFEDAWLILAWVISVIYYGQMGVNTFRGFPNDLLRAFSAISLGTIAFYPVKWMKTQIFTGSRKLLLTFMEIFVFLLCVCITLNIIRTNSSVHYILEIIILGFK